MGKRLTVEFLKADCPLFLRALVAPWRLGCLAAGLAGCDLKVLKCSAGGIATRRARPIRFVRVLATGFAALRAFPPIRFAHLRRIFDPRPLA